MLYDVITRFSTDTGLKPDDNQNRLIDLANRGAKEMYDRLECNKIYRERTLKVPPNRLVTLPNYIGELRGMRTSVTDIPFDLFGFSSPRYVKTTWDYKWKNWRDLAESPVIQLPTSIAPLQISCTPETVPVSLLISGQTDVATRIEETIVLTATSLVTNNNFGPAIYSITCFSPNRTNDILVADSNNVPLARLPNNDNKTRYKIVDVSQFGWPADTTDQSSLVDVLYKLPLRRLTANSDMFPAGDDYDNAWYYAMMYQYYLNDDAKSTSFLKQMLISLDAVKDSSEDQIVKKISFGRNKYIDSVRNTTSVEDLYTGSGKPAGWPYFGVWESW